MEFQAELKRVKKALVIWDKEVYENIFQKVATLEDIIKVKEIQFEVHPTSDNREELKKMQRLY